MPKEMREPQSYGSGPDWVEGKTGTRVNDPKARPAPEHREFYDEKRDAETNAPGQGGEPSPVQMREADDPERGARVADDQPVAKVTSRERGAKRDSFFKRRDYE